MTSPRLLRPRSYSLQFRILYFFLYWRLTRLDCAATMTLPPDLYDGLDPTPAASVLAYTDSCTNARHRYKKRTQDKVNSNGIRDLGVIRDRFRGGLSYRKIAKKYGVSLGCVQKIIQRCQQVNYERIRSYRGMKGDP